MTAWTRQTPEAVDGLHPRELERGDLVFTKRDGGTMDRLTDIAGEQWRHVGAVTEDGDGLPAVVEIHGNAFNHRTFDQFFADYTRAGAMRLDLDPACIHRATDWMDSRIGDPHQYAWDDVILAGLIAATTRASAPTDRDLIRRMIRAAAEHAKPELGHRGKDALTCSAFIARAYKESGAGCALQLKLWRRTRSWPPQIPSLEALDTVTDAEWFGVMEGQSMVDLYNRGAGQARSCNGSFMQGAQVSELARVVFGAVLGLGDSSPLPDRIETDGRWVTPGQIWESPAVHRWELDITAFSSPAPGPSS